MMAEIAEEPFLPQLWVWWLIGVNTAAVLFVRRRVEARWVLLAWALNIPLIGMIPEAFGYERILGLAHIAVWAPLVVYLWRRRARWRALAGWGDRWIAVLLLSNSVSLAFDYADLLRFLAGRIAA